MHRKTRILLCRIAFIGLCVLPTTVVAGWIVTRATTGNAVALKAEWERKLTSRIGLVASIGEVSYPRPQIARLQSVKLLDPETRHLVAEAAVVEIEKETAGWMVDAAGLSIVASELAALRESLDLRLLRGRSPLMIRWLPRAAMIRRDPSGQTLAQLGGTLRCDSVGSSLELEFQLAGQDAGSEPLRLSARRLREAQPPATEWQLNTAGQSLPCSLVGDVLPAVNRLGPDCEFRGTLRIVPAAGGARGELAGTLEHVDFDALVTEQFPQQLSGEATVVIERAAMEQGRLVEIRGEIRAQKGAIGQSLLAAAQQHLGLQAGVELDDIAPQAAITFDQLAVGFQFSGAWLSLMRIAEPAGGGALLMNAGSPLLAAPEGHAATGASLLRTLVPDSRHQVPATRQTAALVRLLPLPDVLPAASDPPAHTPTRLAPAQSPSQSAVRQPVFR